MKSLWSARVPNVCPRCATAKTNPKRWPAPQPANWRTCACATSAPASPTLRFAATVAAYADGLRGGKHLEKWTWEDIARTARQTTGSDPWRQRAEFIELVDSARRLTAGDTPQIGMIAD